MSVSAGGRRTGAAHHDRRLGHLPLSGGGFPPAHLEPMIPADLGEPVRQWHLVMAESPELP
ncbi:hypothetical protein ACFQZU_13650 [Streptomonospora algeriensis]|uniref:Uncharacterized protein n=1 Tax=Streptomonospora algeriensis TaxID=995084 RepID=A0ABW3BHD3_9ACTN